MTSYIRGSDNFDSAGGNACKAWVNFNGTGTVAIRASFNVSSITDNGTGKYSVNFVTPIADANYSAVLGGAQTSTTGSGGPTTYGSNLYLPTTAKIDAMTWNDTSAADWDLINVAIFR